jgi:hypothetical protein
MDHVRKADISGNACHEKGCGMNPLKEMKKLSQNHEFQKE